MRVKFEDNVYSDTIECWGITVVIPRRHLFGRSKEERRKNIIKIINEKIEMILPTIERDLGEICEIDVSLESAWVRYYVFKIECFGEKGIKRYALNILSPNSPIDSFKRFEKIANDLILNFPNNVAKPIYISDDTLLQEWIDGKPLSEFKDGDLIVDEEKAKKLIPMTTSLLYRFKKKNYVYTPWEDYEVMLKGNDLILLDLTRFKKTNLKDCDFFDFYFGVPFTQPYAIKGRDSFYWRGVSEKDYFGTNRRDYIRLFLLGVAMECENFEEFRNVCKFVVDDETVEELWAQRRKLNIQS